MSSRKHPLRRRIRYAIDNTVSAGTISLVAWLGLLTLALIVFAGFILAVFHVTTGDTANPSFIEGAWLSLLRTLDPGTMGGDAGWAFRLVSLTVTLGGIFIVSVLIGLVTTGIDRLIEDLRKGKTPVLESGHTLILGWSPKVHGIVSELAIANENRKGAAIVVMAPKDKVQMEDALRGLKGVGSRRGETRVVCRTGEPADPRDLAIVAPAEARSIVVLSPEGNGGDAQVVRRLLCIRKVAPGTGSRVVAEFADPRNAEAIKQATDGRVRTVVSAEVIARITAQICRLPGLSKVYEDLLDFGGDEIYFGPPGLLAGTAFGDALVSFDAVTPIGVRHPDATVEVLPSMDKVIGDADRLIAIAEDDDRIVPSQVPDDAHLQSTSSADIDDVVRARVLVVGWSEVGPLILNELDRYFASGSEVCVIFDPRYAGEGDPRRIPQLRNFTMRTRPTHVTDVDAIEDELGNAYDHVLILCYREGVGLNEAEAWTLMSLLQVRGTLEEQGRSGEVGVVTELLDVLDVELASAAAPTEFVVSERLTGLMLAQLSENPELEAVFEELFDGEGAEVTLRPAGVYLPREAESSYAAVARAARRRGEVALGYRTAAGEISLNPPKSRLVTFAEGDQVIVLGLLIGG